MVGVSCAGERTSMYVGENGRCVLEKASGPARIAYLNLFRTFAPNRKYVQGLIFKFMLTSYGKVF